MGPASVIINTHISNFIVKGKHNFRYGNIEILLKDDYKSCLQKIRKWVSMGQGIMFFIYSMRKPWTRKPSFHIFHFNEMEEENWCNKCTWENEKKDEHEEDYPLSLHAYNSWKSKIGGLVLEEA